MIATEIQNIKASWLSEIPSHWNVVRLKSIVKGGTNGVWGSEPKNKKNDIICVRVADIDEWQYGISQSDLTYRNISDADQAGRLLNSGDLIIEKSGGGEISPVGRVVIFNLNEKAVTSNFMARLNVIGDINKEFLYYYFRFLYYRRLNHPAIKATTGIQNLDLYAYLQNPIPIPTPKEQISIVEFINQTSGEITRFIQTKQRFIELLKEQRQSIITNAVTKGTDEKAKMKETVLGEIPEHWEVRRLKFIAEVQTRIHHQRF
jgi:type I restriction enzyme S subunit